MNPRDEIQHLVENYNSKSFVRYITRRPTLHQWVLDQQTQLNTQSIPETLYCVIHHTTPTRCECGQPALFNSYPRGYRSSCSTQCSARWQKHSQRIQEVWSDSEKYKNMIERRNQTNLERYGDVNPIRNASVRAKCQQTNLERYGASSPLASAIIQEKIHQINLEKLGVKKPLQSQLIQQRCQESFEKNHGHANKMQIPRQAWRDQHNNLNPFQVPAVQDTLKKTMLARWGVEFAFQNPELKKLQETTTMKNWGRPHWAQLEISDQAYSVLTDPVRLREELETHTLSELAQRYQVRRELIRAHHDRLGLDIIPRRLRSLQEQELADFLLSLGVTVQRNNRTICAPFELDFILPDHKLAVEIGGLYWHSELAGKKSPQYHQQKRLICESQGWELLTIWSDEWLEKPSICTSVIRNKLGQSGQRIAARKCEITTLSNGEIRKFLDDNHLQGHASAHTNLVLKHHNQIVCALTFGKPRYNQKFQWELIRAAVATDTVVLGGFARLWRRFQQTHQPQSVVSYCDRRWFTGKLYQTLGFSLKQTHAPGYWYTDFHSRFHRSQFTKKSLVAQGFPSQLTEWQIMQTQGWDRIWDCGQDTWVWQAE